MGSQQPRSLLGLSHQDPAPLTPPDDDFWHRLGLTIGSELHGGHQSRVFAARGSAGAIVVKLTDGRSIDGAFDARLDLLRRLAEIDDAVVAPIGLGAETVVRHGGWMIVAYPELRGVMPDVGRADEVAEMASTLAALHRSLRSLDAAAVPAVTALRHRWPDDLGERQLIHGDFAPANLIRTAGGLRVIDFDDAGHGSGAFEIGNTLYMELFDCWLTGDDRRFRRFRAAFVDAYGNASENIIDDAAIDLAVRHRIAALDRWLDHPSEAPIGVRLAPQGWRDRLRRFVDEISEQGSAGMSR